MRSWSPPGQRGLQTRNSVDGFTYKGRFRIREVPFSGDNAPSEASAASVRSAPVACRGVPPAGNVSTLTAAAIAAEGSGVSLDQRSDVSDYSFYVAVSEVSENDDTGRLSEGFREDEAWDRRGCAERPASLCRGSGVGGGAGDGGESGRGRQSCLSVGETSETSAGYESELGRSLLVSPTIFCYTTQCKAGSSRGSRGWRCHIGPLFRSANYDK